MTKRIIVALLCLPLLAMQGQITFRRAAVGGAFTPTDIACLGAWYDSTTGITEDGNGISQWDDQSGNGHDVVQATDANKPNTADVSGTQVVDFIRAEAERLDDTTFIDTADVATIFVLGKMDSASSGNSTFFEWSTGAVNSGINFWRSGTELTMRVNDGSQRDASDDPTNNTAHVYRLEYDGVTDTEHRIFEDDSEVASFTTTGTLGNTLDDLQIGGLHFGGWNLDGWIRDFVVFTCVLTTQETSDMETWAAARMP